MEKTIKINVEPNLVFLDIDDILPFQGDLKELSKENYEKLRKSFIDVGCIRPFIIWKNPKDDLWYTEDGHQSIKLLKEMRKTEKYNIPKMPCSVVIAPNEFVAKKIILYLVSQYGTVTAQGLYEFQVSNELPIGFLDELQLPDFDVEKYKNEFFDQNIGVGTADDQGLLDQKQLTKCPKCGETFDHAKHIA